MGSLFYCAADSIRLEIKVIPGASKSEIAGIRDGHLCIRIAAVPQDGKANATLCAFLAKTLGCAKRDIVIVKGEKSRLKTAAIPVAYAPKLHALLPPETP